MQELMKGVPRGMFDRLVAKHQADKHNKGFGCWDQLVAMVYAQMSGTTSLRGLEARFNSQASHHYHLGVSKIHRSTLSEANSKRKPWVFQELACALMSKAERNLRREGQELLYLLDSTSITLKGHGFDHWTQGNRTCHTQGLKLHMLYAAHTQTPVSHRFSAPNVNDIEEGRKLAIECGATYVFDKGYCDYSWWAQLHAQGARFVTRFKNNARLRVEQIRTIPGDVQDIILEDALVRLANPNPGGGRRNHYTETLRRIVIRRADRRPLTLATNDLVSPASEIGRYYQDRWQIELFFKWMKQHLRIRRFLGRSENAVRIQILCALIAYLLLALYRQAHGLKQSLWMLLNEMSATLFQRPAVEYAYHRKRRAWLEEIARRQRGLFA